MVHGSSSSRRSGHRSGLGIGVRLVVISERDGHHHGADGDGGEDSVVELHVGVFVLFFEENKVQTAVLFLQCMYFFLIDRCYGQPLYRSC